MHELGGVERTTGFELIDGVKTSGASEIRPEYPGTLRRNSMRECREGGLNMNFMESYFCQVSNSNPMPPQLYFVCSMKSKLLHMAIKVIHKLTPSLFLPTTSNSNSTCQVLSLLRTGLALPASACVCPSRDICIPSPPSQIPTHPSRLNPKITASLKFLCLTLSSQIGLLFFYLYFCTLYML